VDYGVAVARKKVEAEGICSFELVDAAHGLLPTFRPGSHIDVEVSRNHVRQYSLSNHPEDDIDM
jgi:vanillate monooxygenase ferredoxin subunit